MKIAVVATGAAGMYCGSCLRDNALAVALQKLGHEVTFIPTYTPLRLDESSVKHESVLLNGVRVYAEQKLSFVRRPTSFVRRLLGSQALLRWVSNLALGNEPKKLGALTVSMLQGVDGNQRTSMEELIEWLHAHAPFDVVHLSNSLLSGVAPALKRAMDVPITCGLTGEDYFVDGLEPPYRDLARELVRQNSRSIDRFIAPTDCYRDLIVETFTIDPNAIAVVNPGISLQDYQGELETPPRSDETLKLGYFARIAPEKGGHLLVEAFRQLAAEFPQLELHMAGSLGGQGIPYARGLRARLAAAGLSRRFHLVGTLDRQQKVAFLRSLDVFAMPSIYEESKALPAIEALASGVPIVVPDAGAFREIVERSGGGVLHEPRSASDLAAKLALLLKDSALRTQHASAGRAAAHEWFSSARMAEETAAVFAVAASAAKASRTERDEDSRCAGRH